MSGSGGSGGGGYEPSSDNCEDLVIDTQLSSPKEEIVAKIKTGELLDVDTLTKAGTVVVVVLHKGKIAGGLASTRLAQLRECLAKGTTYTARVISKNGGQVRVRVEAAGS